MIPSLTKAVKPLTTIQYIYIVQEQYNCLLRGGNRGGETIRNTAEKMVRPGEVVADVHPEEPEAADHFHCGTIDVQGVRAPPPAVSYSPQSSPLSCRSEEHTSELQSHLNLLC